MIKLLFKLLGHSYTRPLKIGYLFGASTGGDKSRIRNWEKALARLWKDKDLLDWLYYQVEMDKERIFKGKIRADLHRGARIRTLFIVYNAHRAYLESIKKKSSGPEDKDSITLRVKKLGKSYGEVVDIKK